MFFNLSYLKLSALIETPFCEVIFPLFNPLKVLPLSVISTSVTSKSKAVDGETTLVADQFIYNKNTNVFNAVKNVILENNVKEYKILGEEVNYQIEDKKVTTKGNTNAEINSKYSFKSQDVVFFENDMVLLLNNKSEIKDDKNIL